ncbi:protein FAM3A [Rhynchocyon petersi]
MTYSTERHTATPQNAGRSWYWWRSRKRTTGAEPARTPPTRRNKRGAGRERSQLHPGRHCRGVGPLLRITTCRLGRGVTRAAARARAQGPGLHFPVPVPLLSLWLPIPVLTFSLRRSVPNNGATAGGPSSAGQADMRLAGPLRIVALIVTVGLAWIIVSILLGGPGSSLPRIQQLFSSKWGLFLHHGSDNSATAEPRIKKYKCGLPRPCPEEHLAFRMVSGAANVIGPKICLEDKMLMSSVQDNVGRGLNIALVNGVSGELIEARAFDMWAGDVNDLLKFIRPLHEGTLVFVASYDDPATKMNEETRKLFSELGSRNAKELAFRDSWVFVGAKGVQDKSPFEQHVKNSKHTNKYEGWPEALEMEGCVPRRSAAS